MIYCDTREKKNAHILEYFRLREIPYTVKKLDTGDYMDSGNDHLTIDRKQNLDELVGNLFSPDRSRFWREVRRSRDEHKKMIVLVEHGGQIRQLSDVPKWRGKYTKVTGKALYNEICRVHIAYGVEFLFCDKRHTGKRIVELLGGGSRER
jgi:ERCC4-type nuclease